MGGVGEGGSEALGKREKNGDWSRKVPSLLNGRTGSLRGMMFLHILVGGSWGLPVAC